jgi:hypothetical protein
MDDYTRFVRSIYGVWQFYNGEQGMAESIKALQNKKAARPCWSRRALSIHFKLRLRRG